MPSEVRVAIAARTGTSNGSGLTRRSSNAPSRQDNAEHFRCVGGRPAAEAERASGIRLLRAVRLNASACSSGSSRRSSSARSLNAIDDCAELRYGPTHGPHTLPVLVWILCETQDVFERDASRLNPTVSRSSVRSVQPIDPYKLSVLTRSSRRADPGYWIQIRLFPACTRASCDRTGWSSVPGRSGMDTPSSVSRQVARLEFIDEVRGQLDGVPSHPRPR
jgi:hypothetical protein